MGRGRPECPASFSGLRRPRFAHRVLILNPATVSFCRVSGGISNNDFVLELVSSLICETLDRPSQTEMSALGAAFLAGLASGE